MISLCLPNIKGSVMLLSPSTSMQRKAAPAGAMVSPVPQAGAMFPGISRSPGRIHFIGCSVHSLPLSLPIITGFFGWCSNRPRLSNVFCRGNKITLSLYSSESRNSPKPGFSTRTNSQGSSICLLPD